jgi:UDP-N-acetylmuramoyl-L-alanyl-D-glutamate--2,6-diaminopimelate ligase
MAVSVAGKNDLILIAGKGHEDYQIIGMDKRNFDDRKVAAEAASQEA